jgi:hypothetical protein
VKAHSGISGNGCADPIARYCLTWLWSWRALPALDGNAYTHFYWLAAKDTNEEHSGRKRASTSRLCALSDIKAKLKSEMCKSHRLRSANTDTGYYNYWKDLWPLVNKPATNAFWNNSNLKFYERRNVMRGTSLVQSYSKASFTIRFSPQCKLPHLPLCTLTVCASHTLRLPTQ